jgi:hypothetical protein
MMRHQIDVEDLPRVFFQMFKAHGCNAKDPELWDEIAQLQIVSRDEAEIVEALCELHDLIQAELRRRRH